METSREGGQRSRSDVSARFFDDDRAMLSIAPVVDATASEAT